MGIGLWFSYAAEGFIVVIASESHITFVSAYVLEFCSERRHAIGHGVVYD
jgi:hypothetical protein